MQTLAPPAAEVPIEGMWTGGFVFPQFHVDQSSGRVVVAQRVETVDAWEGFLYDLPDWAFAVCVVAMLVFVWKLWRTARSPRAVGRLVCVRCAYDLTPEAGSTVNTRCPECGVDTGRRPPVLGRSFWQRMLGPAVLTGVVLGAGVAVCWWRLEPVRPFDRTRRWPPLIWPSLSGWVHLQRRQPNVTLTERIDVWSVPEGRAISRTKFGSDTWRLGATIRQVRLLPGGDLVAVTTENSGVAFWVLRVSDGEIMWKSSSDDLRDAALSGLAGASKDGKRVWFWLQHKADNGVETELKEVSLDDGTCRSVGKVVHSQAAPAWRSGEVLAIEKRGGVEWVSIVSVTGGAEVVWPGGQATIGSAVSVDRSSLQQDSSGRRSIVIPDASKAGAPFFWSVALSEAAPTPTRVPALVLTGTGGQLDLSDAGGTVLKSLSTSGSAIPVNGIALPGERWYGTIGQRAVPPHRYLGLVEIGGTFRGVVQVWDISLPADAKKP